MTDARRPSPVSELDGRLLMHTVVMNSLQNTKVQAQRCLQPSQVMSGVPGGLFSGELHIFRISVDVECWSLFIRRRRADQPCSHLLWVIS